MDRYVVSGDGGREGWIDATEVREQIREEVSSPIRVASVVSHLSCRICRVALCVCRVNGFINQSIN